MIPYDILLFLLGSLIAYIFIHWRYKKEIDIRLKWMTKRLVKKKKGNWKMIAAVIITLNISISIIRLIFFAVSDTYFLKSFFTPLCALLIFTILFFKYFYEIIGGKREWKL